MRTNHQRSHRWANQVQEVSATESEPNHAFGEKGKRPNGGLVEITQDRLMFWRRTKSEWGFGEVQRRPRSLPQKACIQVCHLGKVWSNSAVSRRNIFKILSVRRNASFDPSPESLHPNVPPWQSLAPRHGRLAARFGPWGLMECCKSSRVWTMVN